MSIGERIAELRKEKGFTRKTFAEYLDISQFTLRNYENDVHEPGHSFILQVARTFNVSTDYILGLTDIKTPLSPDLLLNTKEEDNHIRKYRSLDPLDKEAVDGLLNTLSKREKQFLKDHPQETEHAYLIQNDRMYMTQYDYGVSAGIGNFLDEWDVPKSIVPVNDTPMAHKADYILKVDGDSMLPKFKNGDRVFVKAQETINMNEMGIFIIDGKCFIKQFKGDYLHSLNPEFDDVVFNENQNIKCVGKVLGKI